MSRGEIGLADALTAAVHLGIQEPAGLRTITELLGLARPPASVTADVRPVADTVRTEAAADFPAPPVPDRPPSTLSRASPVTVLEVASDPIAPVSAPAATLAVPTEDVAELTYRPPLPPARVRPAVTALLGRPRRSTRPDLATLVRTAALGRPVDRIPYETETSLSEGVTIVADIGPPMVPYLDDVDFFVEQLQRTVGRTRSPVVWCDNDAESADLESHRPVVVISSLGQPSAGSRQRWRHWLTSFRGDLVALVPHRGIALPGVRVVAWDDLAGVGRGRG